MNRVEMNWLRELKKKSEQVWKPEEYYMAPDWNVVVFTVIVNVVQSDTFELIFVFIVRVLKKNAQESDTLLPLCHAGWTFITSLF